MRARSHLEHGDAHAHHIIDRRETVQPIPTVGTRDRRIPVAGSEQGQVVEDGSAMRKRRRRRRRRRVAAADAQRSIVHVADACRRAHRARPHVLGVSRIAPSLAAARLHRAVIRSARAPRDRKPSAVRAEGAPARRGGRWRGRGRLQWVASARGGHLNEVDARVRCAAARVPSCQERECRPYVQGYGQDIGKGRLGKPCDAYGGTALASPGRTGRRCHSKSRQARRRRRSSTRSSTFARRWIRRPAGNGSCANPTST